MERRTTVAGLFLAVTITASGCGSLIVTQMSVESLEGRRGFEWETHVADGFVIYSEQGLATTAEVDVIAAKAAQARRIVLAYLQEPAYEPTVSVFFVDGRERMKDLIGRPSNATAYYTSNALCLARVNGRVASATHELLHVVAMNLWGVPQRWVNEGAAVDAAGPWRGHDVHAVCKVLRERGELPPLADITRRFQGLPDLVSYPAVGSFVRYLRQEHGLDTLRQVWDDGRQVLPAATGMNLENLESAWLAVVDEADAAGLDYHLTPDR